MARVERFSVRIRTGSAGTDEPIRFDFNGHTMAFEGGSGGTSSGQDFEGSFSPMSVAHSVAVLGPGSGEWEIERITVRYETSEGDPYEVSFGPVTLDDATAVDIWHDRPLETFDV